MIRSPVVLMLVGCLAGCGLSPVGGQAELDVGTTGSIRPITPAKPSIVDALAPSDWERIRLFASTSMVGTANGDVLDWTNPETGTNGTLTPTAGMRSEPDGRSCRGFALTVSDIRGIRRYRGDACRATDGMWQLFEVVPEDSALL
jgi:surface antigen